MALDTQKKVLIVEDEMEMRFYLMTMVKSLGYDPIITKNGDQGLAALRAQVPDLIILDIMMPEKGGAIVYQELKSHTIFRDIPLIIFSGVDQEAFSHYVGMLNASLEEKTPLPKYYVEKSADPDYLREMILTCMKEGNE